MEKIGWARKLYSVNSTHHPGATGALHQQASRNLPTIDIPRTAPVGRCPMCEALDADLFFRATDRLHQVPGEYIYRRCLSCRTVFQDPRVIPDDLMLCYPSGYHTHVEPDAQANTCSAGAAKKPANSALKRRRISQFRYSIRYAIEASVRGTPQKGFWGRLGRILAFVPRLRERAFGGLTDVLIPRGQDGLRALDVGCGAGGLLLALERAGWDVTGLEWDSQAAALARRNATRPVLEGDFRQMNLPRGSYDLVVLSHVFEHFDDPINTLGRIKELLATSGRAVLFYPNPESLGARIYGKAWFPWEAPRHLVMPPGSALSRAAARVGLVTIEIQSHGKDAAGYFAHSRAYRDGRTVDEYHPALNRSDRFIAQCERLLNIIFRNLGEELVIVLKKGDRS